jgi:hypothetical protein
VLRIIVLVALASLLCRWVLGRWPWDYLRGPSVRTTALRRARAVLGVEAGASRAEVIAAHRRLVALVHPDKGGTDSAMHEANAARDLLLAQLSGPDTGDAGEAP